MVSKAPRSVMNRGVGAANLRCDSRDRRFEPASRVIDQLVEIAEHLETYLAEVAVARSRMGLSAFLAGAQFERPRRLK